jgi:hypothetical protein
LQRLGLAHAAEQLGERITTAVKETTSPHRFLDDLLDAELGVREERRVRTSLRLSGLPLGQTLANFEFSFQPSMDRSRIETLATCAWIREGFTLLLQGPPGVGKTHLAVALGVKAVENGFSVAFFDTPRNTSASERPSDAPTRRSTRGWPTLDSTSRKVRYQADANLRAAGSVPSGRELHRPRFRIARDRGTR